jgi:uncharacterized membrane protein YhaH (DUF805 family)
VGVVIEWMILPFRRYAEFEGRSRRKEYWAFMLLNVVILVVLVALLLAGLPTAVWDTPEVPVTVGEDAMPGPLFWFALGLVGLYFLAILVPSISVTVRRLHDRNMSGWWYLGFIVLGALPLVGPIASLAMFVITLLPGTNGPNRFGEDPKDPGCAAVFA